jgi:hypothetical protein
MARSDFQGKDNRHLRAFIKKKYRYKDINVKKEALKFINNFEHFLKITLRKCGWKINLATQKRFK